MVWRMLRKAVMVSAEAPEVGNLVLGVMRAGSRVGLADWGRAGAGVPSRGRGGIRGGQWGAWRPRLY